jgi:eukaryotic-like serine/threonine-protein kinase
MSDPHEHSDRQERVKALLEIALAIPPLERADELRRVAPDDPDLHPEVLELARASDLAQDEFLSPPLRRPRDATTLVGPASDRLGPYRLVRLLGRGSMGAVYEAVQQTPLARRVAVKVLSTIMNPAIVARRFESERDALSRLDHPGIAKILDAGVARSGHPYLVMELVDGVPLNEFCADGRLSLPDLLRLVASIAEAVHHAHSRGILHRDLKPQNVLVTLASGTPAAKVIDFGVAKLLVPGPDAVRSGTIPGQVFGTPGYMPPEQMVPTPGGVDARADVYALGVLLHELLTDTLPSEQGSRLPPSRIQRRSGPRAAPHELRSSVGELDCIVLKSIERDRALRYPSAQHLADDLLRLIAGLPVAARPPSALYLARKFAARHRASVILASTALLMLVAAVVATSVGLIRARRDRDALSRLQASTEIARQEADTLNNVLASILSSVDPALDGPGVPLQTVLDRATNQSLSAASTSPKTEARLRLTLAKTYESLGQFPRALELLAPALADPDALPVELRLDLLIAQARNEIGMSRPRPALDALDRAAALVPLVTPADRTWVIDVNRANALQLLGQRAEARAVYESLLGRAAADPDAVSAVDRARVLINWGVLLHQMGERDEGEARVLEGRDTVVRALGEDHPLAVTAEHNHAILRMARGDTPGAIARFQAVVPRWTRIAGPSHTSTLNARLQLADLYRRAGRLDDAAGILNDLPALLDSALGTDHTLSIAAVQSRAELAAARSDWPVAVERIRECVRRHEARLGDRDPATWYARAMLVDYTRRGAESDPASAPQAPPGEWRRQLDLILAQAESRFGEADRFVRAIRRLRDAAPAEPQAP